MHTQLERQWKEEGYVVVRGIYSVARAACLRDICERILEQWRRKAEVD